MKKATGLGRGLSALIGEVPAVREAPAAGGVRGIEVARIRPNPDTLAVTSRPTKRAQWRGHRSGRSSPGLETSRM